MKKIIIILIFLILLNISYAQADSTLLIILKDINSKDAIRNMFTHSKLKNLDTKESLTLEKYVYNGEIEYKLSPGKWIITIDVDNTLTEGKDYTVAFEKTIKDKDITLIIYALPVGTLRGSVADSLGNLIGNAKLDFDCDESYDITYPKSTDEFGTFLVEYMPVGKCKISALKGEDIGFEDVFTEHTKINSAQIILNKKVSKDFNWYFYVIILIIIVFVLFLFKYKKEKKKKEKQKEELNKKQKAVLQTLNDKQKKIVNFLLENNNQANQSKMYHSLNMPRTSLTRNIDILKNKNIVEIEKIGKMRKIRLSKWFFS